MNPAMMPAEQALQQREADEASQLLVVPALSLVVCEIFSSLRESKASRR